MGQDTRAHRFWGVGFRVDGDVVVGAEVVALSTAERALLEVLCEAPGRFRSRRQLAERSGVAVEAVDPAMGALRAKLGPAAHHVEARCGGYALWAGPE